jgi:hypothetical protein
MEAYVGHDLKNQKGEISSGLPAALKVVPVLFYLSAVLGTGAMGWCDWKARQAKSAEQELTARKVAYDAEASKVAKELVKLEALTARAGVVSKWMEGALNLQPVCVVINRAAGEDAVISELALSRNPQIPSQVHLALKVSQADSGVIDATLEGIRELNFRAYSAQQTKEGDQLDYKATLVWQNGQAASGKETGGMASR